MIDLANREKVIFGAAAAAAVSFWAFFWAKGWLRRHRSHLTAAQERFIKYATTLEAQQVPLYRSLARKSHRIGKLHLEVGFQKAMQVEAQHLDDLLVEGSKREVELAFWEGLGHNFGRLSGAIVSAFDPQVGLRLISKIEALAASEYAKARVELSDQRLQQLYLGNQVDEEFHQAWATLMLDDLDQEEAEAGEEAAKPAQLS